MWLRHNDGTRAWWDPSRSPQPRCALRGRHFGSPQIPRPARSLMMCRRAAGPDAASGAQRPPGAQRVDVLPLLVAAAVLVLHLIAGARQWPPVVMGVVDEPAHLLTAWLILVALPGNLLKRRLGRWALVSSVAIDLDHIPLYVSDYEFSVDGRPPTLSLAFVLVVLAVSAFLRGNRRQRVVGIALGVALHLVRDLATGPGVPLLWPVYHSSVTVPQTVYLITVVSVAVVATVRPRRGAVRRHG